MNRPEDRAITLRKMVDALPTPTLVVDPAGAIETLNREAADLAGYPLSELAGQSVDRLVPTPHHGVHGKLMRSFWEHPVKRPMGAGRELRIRRMDGSLVPVEIGLSPLEGFGQRLVMVTIVDISMRKHSEERLRQYAQRLERRNRELEEFASAASDLVRSPLRGIVELAGPNVAGGEDGGSDLEHRFRRIVELAEHSLEFVDDLLVLARPDQAAEEDGDCLVDLQDAVDNAVSDVHDSLQQAEADVQVDVLPTVHGRPERLRELFRILLQHAVRSRRPDRRLEIRIQCEPRAPTADHLIVVACNGFGFAPDEISRVFLPFTRLHVGTPRETTGTPFMICRRMVEALHGEIEVTSLANRGDRFAIRLPRAGRVERLGGVEALMVNPDLVSPSLPGQETVRLLLVIGREESARAMRDLLREAVHTRFEVEWIIGLSAGLQSLNRWEYDLTLLVHEAGCLDGLAFLRDPTAVERGVPSVLVLDHEDRDLAFAAIRGGASDVLVRGQFGATELERALRYAVDRTRLRREIEHSRQQAERARELRAIERMSAETRVPHTARAFGSSSIREAVAESFDELISTFHTLLDAAVEERVLKIDHDLADAYDTLARRIGFLGGGPRDTVQLFSEVLKQKAKTANSAKLRVFTEEARLILLEVMGRLVSYYRTQAVGARKSSTAGSTEIGTNDGQ